jgi:predicted ArsR family transcriptional regulator
VIKVTLYMPVAVHPIKARLWQRRADIKPGMSLREIGKLVGVQSPQQIKHHLQTMVNMGTINYVNGQYEFPVDP